MQRRKNKYEKLILNGSIREEFVENRKPVFLYSAGTHFMVSKKFSLKGNFSNKYRTPTFNERYWNPGGNPNIAPETGYSGELSACYTAYKEYHSLSLSNSLFFSKVNDLVQWVSDPVTRPVSEKKVSSAGYELNGRYVYKKSQISIESNFSYTFSNAIIQDHATRENLIGKTLIYSPQHILNQSTYIHFSDFAWV
ncbi:MAG: TonB-dependent receptor [Bacteroidales bacterium]|nr:TonB-dependent receptor [Bacteroidales bacterium]